VLLGLLFAHLAPSFAGAQGVPREALRRDLERDQRNLRAYVRAMPDSLFGFRPTSEVRSFAEQIEHAVLDNVNITSTALTGDTLEWERPDRRRYLSETEALLDLVDRSFEVVFRLLDGASDAELAALGEVFGRYRLPRWRAFQAAREHGTWTLAQTVPYLRLNGITPPSYEVFDPSTREPGGGASGAEEVEGRSPKEDPEPEMRRR